MKFYLKIDHDPEHLKWYLEAIVSNSLDIPKIENIETLFYRNESTVKKSQFSLK